ncbi:MAG: 1-(5-phosphoribosyl)-5-[(5-phosphoribosylamino)methylideneamino]imidazole-4-carboxamide isomerase [Anaerolineae bacterium]|nr:1-(5-phosphoribosyl)-5-[(5-phosphoribosylamino)methylideneamino]imidazole-4-carboxamide isomerase [Anaerolineae bacterium]MDW8173243.1 1-(5-phosphoribosyl)-5-[(5-phosphoribosylamino)methylideneamino]imidazole-4-carboxamide isomerase [Anaerolineae bacterium]
MIVYPAIDLRSGRVVRLREGDPKQQTVFSDNPLTVARQWQAQGATWLHVVNLDGALGEGGPNLTVLEQLIELNMPVQFGGGLRSMTDIEQAISLGVKRVVLGTAAVQQPELVMMVLDKFGPERVTVALDTRHGRVTTHGWQSISQQTSIEVGRYFAARGLRHALYTDVSRDGRLAGVDLEGTLALAKATGLQIIASGGISTLDDLRTLAQTGVISGAVVGMALYCGHFTLREALEAVGEAGRDNAR